MSVCLRDAQTCLQSTCFRTEPPGSSTLDVQRAAVSFFVKLLKPRSCLHKGSTATPPRHRQHLYAQLFIFTLRTCSALLPAVHSIGLKEGEMQLKYTLVVFLSRVRSTYNFLWQPAVRCDCTAIGVYSTTHVFYVVCWPRAGCVVVHTCRFPLRRTQRVNNSFSTYSSSASEAGIATAASCTIVR